MTLFTVKKVELERLAKKIVDDIGYELEKELRAEVLQIKSYFNKNTADKIKYYPEDKAVGSEEYSIAVLNSGRAPGEWPPFNKIRDWVLNTKEGGANNSLPDRVIDDITWRVAKKIKEKGIDPYWFVDKVLERFTV